MNTFYTELELKNLGLHKVGSNVSISRNAIIYNPELVEIGNNVRIDDFVTISGKISIGSYIHIAQFCGLYGGTEGIVMKNFSGLSAKVTVYATSNDYSGNSLTNPMLPEKYESGDKNVQIIFEKHVVVGCNSVILPGAYLAEGCAVGACSLVSKPTEPFGIYAGIPAKRVKERSKKILELEKQFLAEVASS